MPTYNYFCKFCNKQFHYFQKMSDSPYEKCKVCNHEISRLISGGSGLIFKGSGFYLTDYKKSPDKKKEKITKKNKKTKKNNKQKDN